MNCLRISLLGLNVGQFFWNLLTVKGKYETIVIRRDHCQRWVLEFPSKVMTSNLNPFVGMLYMVQVFCEPQTT